MEKKEFLAKPKHQYHVSQRENVFMVPNHKKNGYYYEYLSLCPLTYDFDSKETSGKKSFSCQTKVLISCIPMMGTCHEKDRDYYENQSLSYLTDELYF